MTMTPTEIIAKYATFFDEDSDLRHDLRFDDAAIAGVVHTIWEEYGFDVCEDEYTRWITVGDVLASVERRVCA